MPKPSPKHSAPEPTPTIDQPPEGFEVQQREGWSDEPLTWIPAAPGRSMRGVYLRTIHSTIKVGKDKGKESKHAVLRATQALDIPADEDNDREAISVKVGDMIAVREVAFLRPIFGLDPGMTEVWWIWIALEQMKGRQGQAWQGKIALKPVHPVQAAPAPTAADDDIPF